MAKLLTDHDPGHVHAILGCVALLHFLGRILNAFLLGDAFPYTGTTSGLCMDLLLVSVHSLLPSASLLLPLPTKRNFKNPMIWPEFRLHSLIFASRHVLATLFWLVARHVKNSTAATSLRDRELLITSQHSDGLFSMPLGPFLVMMGLIHGTMYGATQVTKNYGCKENRTTNAMPYNSDVTPLDKQRAKRLYTYAQFLAAAFILAGDPTVAFVPLTGIQAAPLLMTLVRKGKCSAATYHCIYTWSLLFPYFIMIRVSHTGLYDWAPVSFVGRNAVVCTASLAFWMRTGPWHLSKHTVWLVAPCVSTLLSRCLPIAITSSNLVTPLLIHFVFGMSNIIINSIMLKTYSTMILLGLFGMFFGTMKSGIDWTDWGITA